MARRVRFVKSMAASALAVMVLVFAALVSSWVGLDAESRGRGAVARAAQLERDVAQAFENGADYIVVGRPIRDAADPRAAALAIQSTIAGVFGEEAPR